MNSCNYCDNPGAITQSGIYVCDHSHCRQQHLIHPGNNTVTKMFHNNAPGVEFLLKTTFVVAYSKRRDLIFNPFPWFFKTKNRFASDELGEPATHRNYTALCSLIESISIPKIMDIISEVSDDTQLQTALGEHMYHLIKWIIETANVEMEFSELAVCGKNTGNADLYHQFKILHDSTVEANFMTAEWCHLMHGSNIENWHSIIRNGIFNASNTKLMTAGAVLGPGVYLSDNLQVNSGYSTGSLDHGEKQTRNNKHIYSTMVVAVFQVAASKDEYRRNSNIYVVPDATKLLLRYLIVVPRKADLVALSEELEKRFTSTRHNELIMAAKINTRQNTRVVNELSIISKMPQYVSHMEIEHNVYTFVLQTTSQTASQTAAQLTLCIVVVYPENYPFEPPIMYMRSPIVSCTDILPSGVIALPMLLHEWSMIYKTSKIFDVLLSYDIEFVFDGEYDDTIARQVARTIR